MYYTTGYCFYCFLEAQIAGKGIGGRPNSDQSSRIHATHFARTATDSALQFLRTQDMYNNNVGSQGGVGVGIGVGVGPGMGPAANPQPNNPFGNAFYGAGSGLIRGGLGAYGEKILGSSSEYVQSNISRYFSDPQYYFQVNDHYVRNKLKVVLFPFLHRGHWTRITEPVGGRLSYKPPIYDINAPDLYIPFMAFGTYVILAGLSLGLRGKFTPEALNWLFIKGLVGWCLQVSLLKVSLLSLGSGEAPLLDIVAYAGYTFTGMCLAVFGRIAWSYSYYFLMPWACLCMGIFLVKTMKRVLFAEVRSYDSSRHHYLLLFIALAQLPLFIWLGNISVHWLF
ncbi:hypothetical protein VitviT2T_007465 [Vitis vinifera]|uniref:Protein YIF1B n=1 Tax=Vitis vinifera TaxID=29760 RepID=A0ABY9C0C6_VITVI|nr:hypothetical protein VitviT2T_007465 [Vitis vinifera]